MEFVYTTSAVIVDRNNGQISNPMTKYTRAPQTVHNTPVMNILKGYFYIILSQFLYAPCGHIVTGDLNIVRNVKLRDLLSKGPKYREPVSYSWHQNLSIIMDGCEEYARRWAKKEDVEVDTLSEWIKSIADVLKRRIRRL